jgi:hypothetical protein
LSDTEKCLHTLLGDLRRLETNLLSDGWYEKIAAHGKTALLFAEIKNAVDNVRTSLWCRIQANSGQNPEFLVNLVERHRLQRAVELLRSRVDKASPHVSSRQK